MIPKQVLNIKTKERTQKKSHSQTNIFCVTSFLTQRNNRLVKISHRRKKGGIWEETEGADGLESGGEALLLECPHLKWKKKKKKALQNI